MVSRRTSLLLALLIAGCGGVGTGVQSSIGPSGGGKPLVSQQAPPSQFIEFPIPYSSCDAPLSIAAGSDGNLWFTSENGKSICSVSIAGTFATYASPNYPYDIAAGKTGNLWYTEPTASKIAQMTLSSHGITEFPTKTSSADPTAIAKGPDGNMYFAEATVDKIGRVLSSGLVQEYSLSASYGPPTAIASASNGLWYTFGLGSALGLTTTSGTSSTYLFGTGVHANSVIALGEDGNLYSYDYSNAALAEMTTAGTYVGEYPIPGGPVYVDITLGSDGNLWLIDPFANSLVSFNTTSKTFSSAYQIPTASSVPNSATTGPDGNIWFTETGTNKIGVYVLLAQTATPSSINFTAVAQTQTFTVSETNYTGNFTVSGCPTSIVTITPTTAAKKFTVTAKGAGECTLTVADTKQNTSPIAVAVTTTTIPVQ